LSMRNPDMVPYNILGRNYYVSKADAKAMDWDRVVYGSISVRTNEADGTAVHIAPENILVSDSKS
jgi:hypothetical protein